MKRTVSFVSVAVLIVFIIVSMCSLSFATPPCADPAAQKIDFKIVKKTGEHSGSVEITGIVKNLGNLPVKAPCTARLQGPGGIKLGETMSCTNLASQAEIVLKHEMKSWNAGSRSEGEFPGMFTLTVEPGSNVFWQLSDDCTSANNKLERSGADINKLFDPKTKVKGPTPMPRLPVEKK